MRIQASIVEIFAKQYGLFENVNFQCIFTKIQNKSPPTHQSVKNIKTLLEFLETIYQNVRISRETSKELRKPQRPTAQHVTTRVFKRYNDLMSTSQSTK